eukprot:scaffold41209_cov15-Tisochrysis_lutea.AAC.1
MSLDLGLDLGTPPSLYRPACPHLTAINCTPSDPYSHRFDDLVREEITNELKYALGYTAPLLRMLEFLSIKSSTVNSLLHFHLPRKEQMQQWFDCGLITLELPGSLKLVIHPIQVKPEAMKFGPIVITTNARLRYMKEPFSCAPSPPKIFNSYPKHSSTSFSPRVSELVAKCIVDSLLKAITSDETFHGVLQ